MLNFYHAQLNFQVRYSLYLNHYVKHCHLAEVRDYISVRVRVYDVGAEHSRNVMQRDKR